jgi:hypothetical protein
MVQIIDLWFKAEFKNQIFKFAFDRHQRERLFE